MQVEDLHIHDDNSIGPVADNHLVHVPEHGHARKGQFRSLLKSLLKYSPWQYVNRVDVDISSCSASQRLEGILALGGFRAPHLYVAHLKCVMCTLYFSTLTVPSLEPLSTWWPSGVKDTELT